MDRWVPGTREVLTVDRWVPGTWEVLTVDRWVPGTREVSSSGLRRMRGDALGVNDFRAL